MTTPGEPLLTVDSLVVEFATDHGVVAAVNGASLTVGRDETLGIVGESGSGKSVTMLAVMGLLPPTARIVSGSITFDGRDLLAMSERERTRLRGGQMGFVFQNAMTALNPVLRVGRQISESIRRHQPDTGRREARDQAISLLADVGIPDPAKRAAQYPHEFSGGMRQRVMIAIAIANRPRLIIADEPTTALDVTIQAQILSLLDTVRAQSEASLVLITHDLAVVAEVADRVVVMYGGRAVESAPVESTFHASRHPYTRGLLASIPRLEVKAEQLPSIPGQPPDPRSLPPGCPFAARCDQRQGRVECTEEPHMHEVAADHAVACHFPVDAELRVS